MEAAAAYFLGQRSIPVDQNNKTIGSDSGGRLRLLKNEIECIEYLLSKGYRMMKYPEFQSPKGN